MTVTGTLTTPAKAHRFPFFALLRAMRLRRRTYIPPGLSRAQIKDAGIAWELAGYGRGADISMLAIINLQSQR